MQEQEVFMDQTIGERRVQVLKSYDAAFAREAFDAMDEGALEFLSLRLDVEDLPSPSSPDFADTIWQELEDGAREDWNRFSYFVVTESTGKGVTPVFVSADWPSAESFAKTRGVAT
jgi:hypothetical protein